MYTSTASDLGRAAPVFHALADETRLKVVSLLVHGERCVCDLMADLDMAQSRLSWHLKTLSDAGVVTARREGRWNYYALNTNVLAGAGILLDRVASSAHTGCAGAGTDCCGG